MVEANYAAPQGDRPFRCLNENPAGLVLRPESVLHDNVDTIDIKPEAARFITDGPVSPINRIVDAQLFCSRHQPTRKFSPRSTPIVVGSLCVLVEQALDPTAGHSHGSIVVGRAATH